MSSLQKTLLSELKKIGCIAMSMNASGISLKGMPDVMILCNTVTIFCEIKELGDRLSKIQLHRIRQLAEQGFIVRMITSQTDILNTLETVKIISRGN